VAKGEGGLESHKAIPYEQKHALDGNGKHLRENSEVENANNGEKELKMMMKRAKR